MSYIKNYYPVYIMDLDSTRRQLHSGGIPWEPILKKMEETDMTMHGEYEFDEYNDSDIDYKYNAYARAEIIDKNPDAPFMEADKVRRDGAAATNRLNLQYNATRGSSAEIPTHPEMFLGFVDPDPRGASLDPLLKNSRNYISGGKAARMQVSMGNNDDNKIIEQPWTNQDISKGLNDVNKLTRRNMKVFTREKMGRSTGNNTIMANYKPLYQETAENGMQRDIFKETEIYRPTKNPEDVTFIYRKADLDTQYKAQLANLNMTSRNMTQDLIAVQHSVEQMGKFSNSEVSENKKGQAHYNINKIREMSDTMTLLHDQVLNLRQKTASQANVSKAKYLAEQMTNLHNEMQNITLAPGIPQGDLSKISRYVDHMIDMQNQMNSVTYKTKAMQQTGVLPTEMTGDLSNSMQSKTYKKPGELKDNSKIVSYVDYIPMEDSTNTLRYKSVDDHGDVRKAIDNILTDQILAQSTENFTTKAAEKKAKNTAKMALVEMEHDGKTTMSYKTAAPKYERLATEQDKDFSDTTDVRARKTAKLHARNNYNSETTNDYGENAVVSRSSAKKMPKSLRRITMG